MATSAAHGTTRSISARNSRLRLVFRFSPRSAFSIFSACQLSEHIESRFLQTLPNRHLGTLGSAPLAGSLHRCKQSGRWETSASSLNRPSAIGMAEVPRRPRANPKFKEYLGGLHIPHIQRS